MAAPLLRVARPTDNLEALLAFYRDGLGLEVLYRFDDHDGFHGVMLGHPQAPWHLEFTRLDGHAAGRAPSLDNLLVLYLPEPDAWRAAKLRMDEAGFAPVASFNPYWDERGLTYEDPDGYRVVLQNDDWKL
jgi:catechol 2,3-dioxygenase-like lactoylglutathione lyase family enzyme